MDISTYLAKTTGLSMRQLAKASGIQPSKLSRQLSGETALSMETLRDLARATDLDMLDLFEVAGMITRHEARALRSENSLQQATDEQVAEEVLRRMQHGAEQFNESIDAFSESDQTSNVTNLHVAAKTETEDVPEE
ncbi:helix-turn-helix transcriptional regulator [Kocuria sp.]|uniref:helix-turn-helix domain-containing protein n=1 Tax=Kocuria sp. TaxID=1871328 RepID=UPI0026DBA2F0|nr:helix-turn-helix transcriptional regulator [Kocuria sp.]MDO4919897.1 helix-turn-helix transcriptional regulator [Kocuria sp.]